MKPSVFIAGKVAAYDFRHDLVPGLRGHRYEDGPLDCGSFIYVGPFFESCDHGCTHGPNSHGVIGVRGQGCEGFERITPFQVWQRNMRALRRASAIFAYIETNDAYGTLCELGAAQYRQIPTTVLFGPEADAGQMWYSAQGAVACYRRGAFSARNVHREALPELFATFLRTVK